MGLPSIIMSIAMKIIHLIVQITGISFNIISSPILKLAWFLVGNWIGITITILLLISAVITYYFEIWTFSNIF